jgi:hypothetical protein
LIQNELININKYILSVINLFINIDNIIIIDSSKTYKFDKFIYTNTCYTTETNNELIPEINNKIKINICDIHIPTTVNIINYDNYFLNYKHTDLDIMLINKIKTLDFSNNTIKTYENICLIKTENYINESSTNMNKNYSIERSFDNKYIDYFTKKKYYIVDPSIHNITELYMLLNSAKNIVMSWGCMSFINKMIIDNNNVNYILVSHKGYTHEFNFLPAQMMIPPCNKCFLIYNLNSELDNLSVDVINNILDNINNIF